MTKEEEIREVRTKCVACGRNLSATPGQGLWCSPKCYDIGLPIPLPDLGMMEKQAYSYNTTISELLDWIH